MSRDLTNVKVLNIIKHLVRWQSWERYVLSIAANEKMHLAQFDVSTAFLYGELEEIIYIKQPEGYDDGSGRVCELKKSLYGLKQAPRCWNKRFGSFLTKLGFKVSEADPCLYIRDRDGKKLILVVYEDDGWLEQLIHKI